MKRTAAVTLALLLLVALVAWGATTSFLGLQYTGDTSTQMNWDRIDACFSGVEGFPGAPAQCKAPTGGGGGTTSPGGLSGNIQINAAGVFGPYGGATCTAGNAIQSLSANGAPTCASVGTGTVTHIPGPLTLNAGVLGNGTADVKVLGSTCGGGGAAPCFTVDPSGNLQANTLATNDQNVGAENAWTVRGNAGMSVAPSCVGRPAKTLTLVDTSNQASDALRTFHYCLGAIDGPTLPVSNDLLMTRSSTDVLTNKTFDTAGTGNIFKVGGVAVTALSATNAPPKTLAVTSGSFTTNDCVKVDVFGNLVDAGAACGGGAGAGTVTNTTGALPTPQLVVGNGGADITTRSATGCGGAGGGNCGQLLANGTLGSNTYQALDQNPAGPNYIQILGNVGLGTTATCANTGLGKSLTLLDVSNGSSDPARRWDFCDSNTFTGVEIRGTGLSLGGSVPQNAVQGTSGQLIDAAGPFTPGDCARYDASGNLVDGTCQGATVPFSAISSGTNATAAMLISSGASLIPQFSGIIRANDVSCTGCVSNLALASQYSGIGTCPTGFPGTLNPNGAPTCRQVNLASDVTGVLPSKNIGDPAHLDALQPTIDCTGKTDASALLQAALNVLNPGASLWIPSQCVLRFASPGAGGVNVHVPPNMHIICADQSSGFAVNRKICAGPSPGRYPGAACAVDAECLGGAAGSCQTDFGTSSMPYATVGATTYTMFQDNPNVNSQDIVIENCSVWAAQADPYQRCSGGTNVGNPCRQECGSGSTGNGPGARCEVDADCGGGAGSCLLVSDCHAGGGTCSGTPHLPSGPGLINVFDFTRTIGVKFFNVNVYDHFQGAFALSAGDYTTVQNSNFARELTDCTTPFSLGGGTGQTPTTSQCVVPGAAGNEGICCYGALDSNSTNQQPGNLVVNDVILGTDSQVQFVKARGAANGSAITVGTRSRIDESAAWPNAYWGPGQAGGGFILGALSIAAKSYILWWGGGVGDIAINAGADASAVEDRIQAANGVSTGTAIQLTGANGHAVLNNIKGLGGSMIGIEAQGNYDEIRGNYVEGAAPTGEAIHICGASCGAGGVAPGNVTVSGNFLVSSPANQMLAGIVSQGSYADIASNQITNMLGESIFIKGGPLSNRITDNTSALAGLTFVYSLAPNTRPVHVLSDTATQQLTIANNIFNGGWLGYECTYAGGLTNTGLIGNRFVSLGGPPTACGGAGLQLANNYVNNAATTVPLVCDASCSGGTFGAGQICAMDSQCGTCGASVNKCVPQAAFGYLTSPMVQGATGGSAHNLYQSNLLFDGSGAIKQCGGGTVSNPGQLCTSSLASGTGTQGTCATGGVCTLNGNGGTAGTYLCVGGADAGQLCCVTGTATCSVRDQAPLIRVVDPGANNTNSDVNFVGNQIFGNTATLQNVTAFAMNSPGGVSLGHVTVQNSRFGPNTIDLTGLSGNIGFDWPLTPGANFTGNLFSDNNLLGAIPMQNWLTTMGITMEPSELYESTANSTAVTNTLTETGFNQAYTLPANSSWVGRTFHVRARGFYSTTGTPTIILNLRYGAVNTNPILCGMGATVSPALPSGAATLPWQFDCDITVRSLGASGTMVGNGAVAIGAAALATQLYATPLSNHATVTVDTTTATALTLFAKWSAASSSNTITMEQFWVNAN